jgi:hypothetical protein
LLPPITEREQKWRWRAVEEKVKYLGKSGVKRGKVV